MKADKPLAEVPTPSFWGMFPELDNFSFSTLCGDGTLAKVTFNPDGSFSSLKKSAPFFDADKEPIQASANRADQDWLFTGFAGKIYRVNYSGAQPVLKDAFAFSKGIEGNWVPGGYDMAAYNAANQVLFVLIPPDAENGSHKNSVKKSGRWI